MFNGDFILHDPDLNDPLALARLGPEARSILKSIQTEDTKLQSSTSPARSDLHYFRARFNYYRLSLLRLLPEEKSVLEPILARFLHRIVAFEGDVGTPESSFTPFLAPVEKFVAPRASPQAASAPAAANTPLKSSRSNAEEIISQLHLIKMALASDIDALGRRALSDGLERVIQSLKSSL